MSASAAGTSVLIDVAQLVVLAEVDHAGGVGVAMGAPKKLG
jgi:hypothetical protein